MSKNLKLRAGVVALIVIFAIIYLVPSLNKNLPPWWSDALPTSKVNLGLDLQGGISLNLEVEADKAVQSDVERVLEEMRSDMRKSGIRFLDLKLMGTEAVSVTLLRNEDESALQTIVRNNFPDFDLRFPEDTGGKPVAHLTLLPRAKDRIERMAVEQALETIRNRVDQFGVSEPDIRPAGKNGILIQLPGIKDPKRAVALIGKTALLEFKLVDEDHSVQEALQGRIPPGDEILYENHVDTRTGLMTKTPFLLKKRTLLTGEYITDARVEIDSRDNQPYVSLTFDSRGARLFEEITGHNIGKRLAIVLDNKVNSAPVIQDKISGGRAQITGHFSMQDAKDLAIVLRAGALPAPVKIIEERTVGPSLGSDSIHEGFLAAIIGGLAVVLFMAIYYSLSGIIADIALILNIVLIMSGLAFFGATLTLPGIAGIVLTIGMAVDANVLIFERIREELRLGKTPRASIDAGYGKAFVTIVDANITTLITALVLFQFGTGPVKGFAVTLSIGILASMFTAIFVTRVIFDYLYTHVRLKSVSI